MLTTAARHVSAPDGGGQYSGVKGIDGEVPRDSASLPDQVTPSEKSRPTQT